MTIDRITPTKRPAGPPQGYQQWRSLLFLHWEVPVALLRSLVPKSLDIDTYEGRAYVGLVPFTMQNVRPFRFLPAIPGTANFHETNVRTYVLHEGGNPGVWFFSLDAANRLAVYAARTFFHLPYHYATMDLRVDGSTVHYQSRRHSGEARLNLQYTVEEVLPSSQVGTLQFFLAERYFLYATSASGRLFRGQVHHRPYPLHKARVHQIEETLLSAAQIAHGEQRTADYFSPGVDVELFALTTV